MKNTRFGHLVDGELVIPSLPIKHNNKDYFTQNPTLMLELGQKEIIYTTEPEVTAKGSYLSEYTETDTQIIQVWTFVPYTGEQLRKEYETRTVKYIRGNYSVDDENKILREYLAYPDNIEAKEAFNVYNTAIEECKKKAYADVYE
jgi:hypothetical protein